MPAPTPVDQAAASGGVANPAFSTILTAMRTRIVNALGASKYTCRTCAVPNDRVHEYFSDRAVVLRVRNADPDPQAGAGRYGYVIERNVDVFVVTENLSDEGGSDAAAVGRHCDREEAVINALLLNPPVDTTYANAVGKTIKWVPGGTDIMREIKTDPGLLASCLCFRIMYPLNALVYRL